MGRGVFRIGVARVGHGGVEGGRGQSSQRKEIPLTMLAACQRHSNDGRMLRLVETDIMPIIYAIQLCDVIILTKEWSIMQATCINYCVRLA